MRFNLATTFAALAALASAQTDKEMEDYPRMAELMAAQNLTWTSEEVVSEDGYHLSMFRITGSTVTGPYEITKPPILAMHPMLTNSQYWVDPIYHTMTKALMIQMAEAGYDVWLGAVRGDNYS